MPFREAILGAIEPRLGSIHLLFVFALIPLAWLKVSMTAEMSPTPAASSSSLLSESVKPLA